MSCTLPHEHHFRGREELIVLHRGLFLRRAPKVTVIRDDKKDGPVAKRLNGCVSFTVHVKGRSLPIVNPII